MANYVLLDRIELNNTAASVTFDNIPQSGYTDLKIVISGRTNRALEVDGINVSFNTGGTYSGRRLYGAGSGTPGSDTTYAGMPFMTAANATANTYGNAEIYIPNYRSSNAKSFSIDGVGETNATTTYMGLGAGLWSGTGAITTVTLSPETGTALLAGSTFSLYGIAQVGTTPAIAPKADGGNVIATDGTYWYHAFLSNGTFTPQVGLSCDYLVVAGGGGGGNNNGGGGGAGGLRSTVTATGGGGSLESAISVAANTNYAITIGAGGASTNGTTTGGPGFDGTSSTFSTVTSVGGGGGGGYPSNLNGRSGGSGGGVGNNPTATSGSGTTNQGYRGGTSGNAIGGGGGGGGAGAVGTNETGSAAGSGGAGVAISTFASATGTGVSNYYAGGGGAGTFSGSYGTGGAGGGGNGAATGVAGVVNTGSGGGGSGANSSTNYSGAGGSGIIIIRYAV